MPNQMLELMKLAWKRCSGDINTVMSFIIGAVVFFFVWMFYAGLQLGVNYKEVIGKPIPVDAAMYLLAYWNSLIYGLVNAASFLLFIAILVCLAEYAGNFVYVCYYYDNCTWETPKQIRKFFDEINLHLKKVRKLNQEESFTNKCDLKYEIQKIKNS